MRVLLGLGGNLGEPEAAFRRVLEAIGRRNRVVDVSSLYRTRAIGPRQPDFLNLAAVVSAGCGPLQLLDFCLGLEEQEGRRRAEGERWEPRLLDVDLLMARDVVHRGSRLELPHPRFHERAFALVPAAELVADWVHPILGRTIGTLAEEAVKNTPDAILERLPFDWS